MSKPIRPPPSTPLGRPVSPHGMDSTPHTPSAGAGLDETPLASLQANILRTKLSTAQNDLARAKRDLKAANEKALSMSIKLNEEKVAKVALTQKYAAVVNRVREIDERMKEAEEVMLSERKHHKDLQKTVDVLREQLKQKQGIIENQSAMLQKLQQERDEEAQGLRENLDRTGATAEALRERQIQFMEHFRNLLSDSMDRLCEERESKDTLFVVTSSEISSTVTELQQQLHRIQLENENMRDSLHFVVREVEEECNALVLTLLRENKEVWGQLNSCKAELARVRDHDKGRMALAAQGQLQDQIETLTAENRKLEERLKRSNEALTKHVRKGQEHERNFQQLMDSLRHAEAERQRLAEANSELTGANNHLTSQVKQLQKQADDATRKLDQLRSTLQKELSGEREKLRMAEEEHQREVTGLKAEASREKGRAEDEIKHLTRQLKEVAGEKEKLAKELQRAAEHMNILKQNIEEERNVVVMQLKEELNLSRTVYERELEELRKELAARGQELGNLQKVADKDRLEATSMRMEHGALTKSVEDLRGENQGLHEEIKRLMEKQQDRMRELEMKRGEVSELEGRLRSLEQEVARQTAQLREERKGAEEERKEIQSQLTSCKRRLEEAETRRLSLERENKQLQVLASRDGKRAREDLERDKALLAQENQRILREYESVNEQNTRLLAELNRHRDRIAQEQQLQEQIQMYQRQLNALQHQAEELQDARENAARAEGEAEELRRERDALQARFDALVDESSALHRKEVELDQCVEAADLQIRRLEQQMEQASMYTASLPRPSKASPLLGSPGDRYLSSRASASPITSSSPLFGRHSYDTRINSPQRGA